MSAETATRSNGRVFDRIAAGYDRHRPTYPEELVDCACRIAGLRRGDPVLELGCGSGQLTAGLLARGLRVTALEPGANLMALAAERVRGLGEIEFVQARFEDADLPTGGFRALFSASAFHWIDPAVSWRRTARLLEPGGTLALIQYAGLREERTAGDQEALLGALARIAPEAAASWPSYRDFEGTLAGARARSGNISEAWTWLGGADVARAEAGSLFGDLDIAAVPVLLEQTAQELNALLRTASFHSRLTPAQVGALDRESELLEERLGRPIRSSTVALLVTARARRG